MTRDPSSEFVRDVLSDNAAATFDTSARLLFEVTQRLAQRLDEAELAGHLTHPEARRYHAAIQRVEETAATLQDLARAIRQRG